MPKDPKAPSVKSSLRDIYQGYSKYFPQIVDITTGQILPTERAILEAQQALSPQTANVIASNYAQLGPKVLETVGGLTQQGLRQDTETLNEVSPGYLTAIRRAEGFLNPGSPELQQESTQAYRNAVAALDPGKIFPEAERLVNLENIRSGNAGNAPNATTTTSNAMRFGDYKTNRINQLNALLNGATNFLNSGVLRADYFGRGTNMVPVETRFSDLNASRNQIGDMTQSLGQAMLGGSFGLQDTRMKIDANRRDTLDRINESGRTLGSVLGAAGGSF